MPLDRLLAWTQVLLIVVAGAFAAATWQAAEQLRAAAEAEAETLPPDPFEGEADADLSVRWQRGFVEDDRALEDGKALLERGRYAEALKRLEQARETARWSAVKTKNAQPRLDQIDTLIRQVKREQGKAR